MPLASAELSLTQTKFKSFWIAGSLIQVFQTEESTVKPLSCLGNLTQISLAEVRTPIPRGHYLMTGGSRMCFRVLGSLFVQTEKLVS